MILLDDAQSSSSEPSSRLYQDVLHTWRIQASKNRDETQSSVEQCLAEISASLKNGEYVVAAFAYELGNLFHHLHSRSSKQPLIQAWSFKSVKKISKEQVDALISNQLKTLHPFANNSGVLDLNASVTQAQFESDVDRIQEYIRNGDSYQINYTYRITGKVYGSPLALYAKLRQRQPGRFGAFIQNGMRCILSQSPELFIQKQGNVLTAMPMKGTASALDHCASSLSDDPKNRAENLMIVDLLRNDLGRLAIPGTINAPKLFEVARHGDVLQMTSTVQATIKPDISLLEILSAVFPCGSVTGAPKKRSMEIIQELESDDRGLYCGALGWLDPDGDFALSVPIRTIEINQNNKTHASRLVLGVGAGITIDSDPTLEWDECQIKSAFLMELPSSIGLFETILLKDGQAINLEAHLSRMQHSAKAMRIPFDETVARNLISNDCNAVEHTKAHRLRLDLDYQGQLSTTFGLLEPLPNKVKIYWAKNLLRNPSDSILDSDNPLLLHKTYCRQFYDEAWRTAANKGGFDALFTNELGFVTEGGRSSIFIKVNNSDEWLTPPLSAGVLPGITRAKLLADPQWNIRETNLTIDDVENAKEIMLSNALRGLIPAYL